ncbi:MAG: chemotaxis protein CheW [Chitinophagales bacterium]
MLNELLGVFIEDLRDSLLSFDEKLMALRSGARGDGVINELFRVAHTIKGNSAAMDFMKMEKVMHSVEDILQEIRNGEREVTEDVIDLLYNSHDFLEDCIGIVARDHADQQLQIEGILNRIESLRNPGTKTEVNLLFNQAENITEEENLLEIIRANRERGYEAYAITVTLSPDCAMKSVRAWLVFEEVDNQVILVFSDPERPSEETFRRPDYSFEANTIHMVVLSEQGIDSLIEQLQETSEIEQVTSRNLGSMDEVRLLMQKARIERELAALISEVGTVLLQEDIVQKQFQDLAAYMDAIADIGKDYPLINDYAATVALNLSEAAKGRPRLTREGGEALADILRLLEQCVRIPDKSESEPLSVQIRAALERMLAGIIEDQRLGEILVEKGLLDEYEIDKLLIKQKKDHPQLRLGQVIVKENKVPAYDVMQVLKEQQGEREARKPAAGSESGYVRVPVNKVDSLMDMLGELLILNSQLDQCVAESVTQDNVTTNVLSRTAKLIKSIQTLSMSLRMVEIRPTLHRLSRIARDTAAELSKRVNVVLEGEETEVDRSAVERLFDPLMHLVRNAVSHGIEAENERVALGKKPEGQVVIRCYSKRGNVYIEVEDDGRGMDCSRILDKAKKLNMAEENREYNEDEILRFIFRPGFSTQEEINNISGRGVGMNVVEEEVRRAGGRVEIINKPGQGCTFLLRIPMNLAVVNGTVVEVANGRYIIPTLFIKEFYVVNEGNWVNLMGNLGAIRLRDTIVPVLWPERVFDIHSTACSRECREVVVLELEQRLLAFPVDRIVARQEIVSKPLIDELNDLGFASGASILGDGTVSLILDVEAIFSMVDQVRAG